MDKNFPFFLSLLETGCHEVISKTKQNRKNLGGEEGANARKRHLDEASLAFFFVVTIFVVGGIF